MPTVLLIRGYRFFFYSNEHLPKHVHIKKGGSKAKLVLEPEVIIDKNHGFKLQEIREIVEIALEHYDYIIEKWNETFS